MREENFWCKKPRYSEVRVIARRVIARYDCKTKFQHDMVLFGGQNHAFVVPSTKEGGEIHCTQIHEYKERLFRSTLIYIDLY